MHKLGCRQEHVGSEPLLATVHLALGTCRRAQLRVAFPDVSLQSSPHVAVSRYMIDCVGVDWFLPVRLRLCRALAPFSQLPK